MSLTSLFFLIFMAVVVLVYYLVPKNVQWIWLLIASLAFYIINAKGYTIFLLIFAVITYGFGICFEKNKSKWLMVLELILIFGLVVVLKNAPWFGEGFTGFLTKISLMKPEGFLAALGISYISLMGCGYSIDVYRGTIKAERNFFKVLAFLAFFPSINQGPINRYEDLRVQFKTPHHFSYEVLTSGIQRMIWGFFKVLVIGERFTTIGSTLTADWGETLYTGWYVFLAIAASSLGLFMNFSGGMDIVIGAAEILGIKLPENFNHPFTSKSIPEFWRKWHITLGGWLRDYVMYSFTMSKAAKKLGKSVKEKVNRKFASGLINIIGVIFVWLIFGLWHGIGWNYLLTAAYYGILIILGILLESPIKSFNKKYPKFTSSKGYEIFRMVRTFFLWMMGVLLLMMPSVKQGFAYIVTIFTKPAGSIAIAKGKLLSEINILGLDVYDFLVLILSFVLWIVVARLQSKKDVRERLADMNILGRWAILLGMIIAIVLFGFYGGGFDAGAFIYQGF